MKPDEKKLLDNLGKIAYTVDKAYLSKLNSDYGVLYFDEGYNKKEEISYSSNIRALRVERWTLDKNHSPGECFKNVLNLFADGDHTVAMVVKRKPTQTEMYFVIKNEGSGRNEDSRDNIELLDYSLKGNFPGTKTQRVDNPEKVFNFIEETSISVLVNNPSHKTKDYITQGLDKLLNGIVPQAEEDSYSIVFLAESLKQSDIREILSGYEEMATALIPFLQYQFQAGESEMDTMGEMKSLTKSDSISNSIFKTHSLNIGGNRSSSAGTTKTLSESKTKGASYGGSGGIDLGVLSFGANASVNLSRTIGGSIAKAITNTLGVSSGYGYSWGKSKTITTGESETSGTSSSLSIGTTKNTSYTYKSYMVQNLLKKLEKTMDRIDESQATGLWKFATYVLAKDSKVSENVANYLRSITQGDESHIDPSVIQEWSYEESNGYTSFEEIKKYVKHFTHPVFISNSDDRGNVMPVTSTAYVGTNELSYVISFSRNSLQGLSILECVQFGREPHCLLNMDFDFEMGCAYHMHQVIRNQRISLSSQELTKHTFITGSTGSGKSNTIYRILDEANKKGIKFLVIEPAKGEYRQVFGGRTDVSVYGTNIRYSKLLKINPFKFPGDIHVLEHIDRLIEIFNACWPMYAAMPAVLKEAIEMAYELKGWDLNYSLNYNEESKYPTFKDLLKTLKIVIDHSGYAEELKSNYTGALVTRVKSLTNGLLGQIFAEEDLADKLLFDENVIVDLSRVSSVETKALIMGMLFIKLQEYRMCEKTQANSQLKHLTVLEEAHNLLKRCSTTQSQEDSNLQGKSVEMISNSIAEMRTYGEGFIIADQAPNLLDESVIRNTNTKIILRLPQYEDRQSVGRSASLTDDQINEIPKLETGVAIMYQNNWLEPVLCKVDEFHDFKPLKYEFNLMEHLNLNRLNNSQLLHLLMRGRVNESRLFGEEEIDKLIDWLPISTLNGKHKKIVLKNLSDYKENSQMALWEQENFETLCDIICSIIDKNKMTFYAMNSNNLENWTQRCKEFIKTQIKCENQEVEYAIIQCLLSSKAKEDPNFEPFYFQWVDDIKNKRGLIA